MPNFCAVVGYSNRSGGHHFPPDKELRQKWIGAIRRVANKKDKPWYPSESSVICNKHFLPSDYASTTVTGEHNLNIIFYLLYLFLFIIF